MSDAAERSAPLAVAPLKVLLAEDNVTNQKLAVAILKKAGHTVVVAENGRQAVGYFESERFDLILMDMQMPELDGIEATEAIRSLERSSGARTPIVAVTANAMQGDRERCMNAGMDDYLSKPLRGVDLLNVIGRLVSSVKTVGPTSNSNGRVGGSGNGLEIFNYAASLEQLEGDRELLSQLTTVFLEQLPSLLPPLAAAVAAHDAACIRNSAHALSSSVGALAAPRADGIARKLEAMGLSGELSVVASTHQELLIEFQTLERVLLATPELKAA